MNRFCVLFFVVLGIVSCEKALVEDMPAETGEQEEINYVIPGRVAIKLTEDAETKFEVRTDTKGNVKTGFASIDDLIHTLGATEVKPVFKEGGEFAERRRKAGLHLWYYVYFDENMPATRAASGFSDIAEVTEATTLRLARRMGSEPIRKGVLHHGTKAPQTAMPYDDPYLPEQWHYNNTGENLNLDLASQEINPFIAGADINLFSAWEKVSGDPSVIVAVVDGGIDYEHEDLADNMWNHFDPALEETIYGWNFYSDNQVLVPEDHGTHIAGTIAAVNNNGTGVSGIAGGSGSGDGAKLMSCQVFVPVPGSDEVLGYVDPEVMAFAADNGAVISQNSWGYTFSNSETPKMDLLMQNAINYFVANAGTDGDGTQTGPMKGGIVIFSAGNSGTSRKGYPAAAPNVLSVASIGPDYKRAYYSSYGDWVDVTAPGGSFRHYISNSQYLSYDEGGVLSTVTDNGYAYMQGTSMSCPHISGIAALIVSKFGVGNPGFTPNDLINKLCLTTRSLDEYNFGFMGMMGAGLADADWALAEDQGIPPDVVTDLSVDWNYTSVNVAWSLTADGDDGVPAKYTVYLSSSPVAGLDPANLPSGVKKKTVAVTNRTPGTNMSASFTGLSEETVYYAGIVSQDRHGNYSDGAFAQGTTLKDYAPVLADGGIPDQYIDDLNSRPAISLPPYFTHHNMAGVTYSVAGFDGEHLNVLINNGQLTIIPLKYGITTVKVSAAYDIYTTDAAFKVMVRDGTREADIYPNPADGYVNIRLAPGYGGQGVVRLYSSAGTKVLERAVGIVPYDVVRVELAGISAGTYVLELEYNGKKVRQNIVKL